MDTQSLRLAYLRHSGWRPQQVLDVGAHRGNWARSFNAIFPEAEIFMIEADPRHEPALKATGMPYRIALAGSSAGTTAFHTLDDPTLSQGASMYRENTPIYDQAGVTIELPVIRVDDIVIETNIDKVNFLKLDVQGAELDVLQGATRLLATQQVDFVLAELSLIRFNNGAPLADEVITYMRTVGFGVHDIFELHYWNDQQLCQIDVLFARDRFLTSALVSHR